VVLGNLPVLEDLRTRSDSCLLFRDRERIVVLFDLGVGESATAGAYSFKDGSNIKRIANHGGSLFCAATCNASEYHFGGSNRRQHRAQYLPLN
jgi:hypothetical protein